MLVPVIHIGSIDYADPTLSYSEHADVGVRRHVQQPVRATRSGTLVTQ